MKNKKISVIIRALEENPPTIKSIPKDSNIEIIVSTWKAPDFNNDTRTSSVVESNVVARNDGAMQATGDIFVFMDDDLVFTKEFFYKTISLCNSGIVVGLDNPWQHFIIGRYIVITKEDFFRAGGIDPHMFYHDDMSFSYKLESMGYELVKLPQDSVRCLGKVVSERYGKMMFFRYMRIQFVLALLYPKLHFWRVPRNTFDFWYHKYLYRRGKLE